MKTFFCCVEEKVFQMFDIKIKIVFEFYETFWKKFIISWIFKQLTKKAGSKKSFQLHSLLTTLVELSNQNFSVTLKRRTDILVEEKLWSVNFRGKTFLRPWIEKKIRKLGLVVNNVASQSTQVPQSSINIYSAFSFFLEGWKVIYQKKINYISRYWSSLLLIVWPYLFWF